MSAADLLKQKNGLKTTQSVLQKQQSGQDAAEKSSAEQMNMNTAKAMLHGKENALTPPKDGHEAAVRMNQQSAEGLMHQPSIPIVKKTVPEKEAAPGNTEKPRGMSYADMFKMIKPEVAAKSEKDEKRERTRMRIAAIGDGLRALSNIYFATKGAQVIHNPEQDLTGSMLKRKQMIDAQREKNRSAWINGYQKALALDEKARKNDRTLAEQARHNKEMESILHQKADQGDTKLEQSQQRLEQGQKKLDLTADRINEIVRHNKSMEEVAQQNANTRSVSARSGGKSAKATTTAQKQWCMNQVIQYANQSNENAEKVIKAVASVGGKKLDLNSAEGVYNAVVAGTKQPSKPAKKGGGTAGKGGNSAGGKKKTGVNWK